MTTAKHQEEARRLVAEPWPVEDLVNRVALALSSRDAEIREVLEGLRDDDCFDACFLRCEDSNGFSHTDACLAARVVWERVQVKEKNNEQTK